MRLIILLIALVIGGLLVARQLRTPESQDASASSSSGQSVPEVPTTPQGVPKFQKAMTGFVDKTNSDLKKQIKDATQ